MSTRVPRATTAIAFLSFALAIDDTAMAATSRTAHQTVAKPPAVTAARLARHPRTKRRGRARDDAQGRPGGHGVQEPHGRG